MFPRTWIIFALCYAPYVSCSQTEISACDAADVEYYEVNDSLGFALDNLTTIFQLTLDRNLTRYPVASVDPAQAQSAIEELCTQLNMLATAAENVINRCFPTSERCQAYSPPHGYTRGLTLTPDVLRTLARFFTDNQAQENVQHVQILGPCWMMFSVRSIPASVDAGAEETMRINQEMRNEVEAFNENATVSCGFTCGRKCACRNMQVMLPLFAGQPHFKADIREVCGQKQHDLAQELQKRLLNALNCSEFGDYVKEWGWLKVNYQANQTTLALHH